jgi:hypothetical protein
MRRRKDKDEKQQELREIEQTLKRVEHLEEEILAGERQITSFTVHRKGESNMALPISVVGSVEEIVATPNTASGPASGLPSGSGIPSWTVSDSTIASVVVDPADPSQLSIKATVLAAGTVTYNMSCKVPSSTDPSGFITATGGAGLTETYSASQVGDVISFSIARTQ